MSRVVAMDLVVSHEYIFKFSRDSSCVGIKTYRL